MLAGDKRQNWTTAEYLIKIRFLCWNILCKMMAERGSERIKWNTKKISKMRLWNENAKVTHLFRSMQNETRRKCAKRKRNKRKNSCETKFHVSMGKVCVVLMIHHNKYSNDVISYVFPSGWPLSLFWSDLNSFRFVCFAWAHFNTLLFCPDDTLVCTEKCTIDGIYWMRHSCYSAHRCDIHS